MKKRLLALLLALSAYAAQAKPLIVLDSGHSPAQGGALSLRGIAEVEYNDRAVAELQALLSAAGWQVLLTRRPGEEISLAERAALANAAGADLFLSIHHDSAQPDLLEAIEVKGKATYRSRQALRGYSLFVSQDNPQSARSLAAAEAIGRALRAIGRAPSPHHHAPIAGEGRAWLNQAFGVYRYDGLAVLRRTHMPAVLLELAVIVDAQDEAAAEDARQRRQWLEAVAAGLAEYCKTYLEEQCSLSEQ